MHQKFLKINKTCNFRCGSRTSTQTHGIPSPTHTQLPLTPNGPSVTTKKAKHRVPSPPRTRSVVFRNIHNTHRQQPKTELCLCVWGRNGQTSLACKDDDDRVVLSSTQFTTSSDCKITAMDKVGVNCSCCIDNCLPTPILCCGVLIGRWDLRQRYFVWC